MNQEQEETEEENNPPESLEPGPEPEPEPEPEVETEGEPVAEPEQNVHPGTGSNNEFEFYFQFTKPLVLYLPSPDERAIAAAWVQKLEARPQNEEERQLRLNYLKLLLFVLQRGHLTGIFRKQPSPGPLQPFPQGFTMIDMGNLMIDQSEAPGSGGGDGQSMPYTIEISNDLREFVAAQEIPNFGVQMYYAWSADEPVYKWNLFNENNFPKYIIDKIKLLKEAKSEEKGGILDKYCKKKPCDLPLIERGPKSKVKSPEEIEQSQARSYQTYVGLVGRMGNAYKGICDDDQDKYNKPEQRKCRNQRGKKGMTMPMLEQPYDNPAELARSEGINPFFHHQAQGIRAEQGQGQLVCRCPPNFHLPNCEVRKAQMDRWQPPIPPSTPSGLATDAYVRGERSEQVEDVMEMPAPDSPYPTRMRPPSRGFERAFFRGPLTKKSDPSTSRKIKPQSAKVDDLSKKTEAVVSKKGVPPRKPGSGKCFCTNQLCSCPCPRGPPTKGKRPVQSTGTAGQSNVPDPLWCQQPITEPSASLPAWARRGLEEQELLNPVTNEYTLPDLSYVYPVPQESRPSRRKWKKVPPEQAQPCPSREPSPGMPGMSGMPAVTSQQTPSKREEKIATRPGPSTASTQREDGYPTTSKPTQKSLPGQSGAPQQGSFTVGTGGRLADMAGILAEIKQKTEAHKIKCKPVSARIPVEADVNVERIPRTPIQAQAQIQAQIQPQPQYEPIPHCPKQSMPVHQPVPTVTKYGGNTFAKAPKRPEYLDVMERRKRAQKVAKDLFGSKDAFSKGTLEGIEPLGDEGEYVSAESVEECIADSSSSFECIDDQVSGTYVKKTQIPSFVPETPEQDATLTQDLRSPNQAGVRKIYTSTPKDSYFPTDLSSIPHCSPIQSFPHTPPSTRPVQPCRRPQQSPDYLPYEPMPPSPGGTYFGTPDPRQPPEFVPVGTYQMCPQNQQRPPNDYIQNYETTSFYAPPAVCVPESDSGTFESTLTPGTPSAQAAPISMTVPEMKSYRTSERRNRSSSREREERRDETWVQGPPRGTPRRKRNDTWGTMNGEPVSEREWGATKRNEITDWATMQGELIENESEGERKRRADNLLPRQNVPALPEIGRAREATKRAEGWATMYDELICESERERIRDGNPILLQGVSVPAEINRAREAARVDDWETMHGELICENERAREAARETARRVDDWEAMHGELICENERAKEAVRETARRVDDWETMHGELISGSEREAERRRGVNTVPVQCVPTPAEVERVERRRGENYAQMRSVPPPAEDGRIREVARRVNDWAPFVPVSGAGGRENVWVPLNVYNSCREWDEEGRRDDTGHQ